VLVPVFFNRRDQKSPRISARASMMVPLPGIEPGTRGFSIRLANNTIRIKIRHLALFDFQMELPKTNLQTACFGLT